MDNSGKKGIQLDHPLTVGDILFQFPQQDLETQCRTEDDMWLGEYLYTVSRSVNSIGDHGFHTRQRCIGRTNVVLLVLLVNVPLCMRGIPLQTS